MILPALTASSPRSCSAADSSVFENSTFACIIAADARAGEHLSLAGGILPQSGLGGGQPGDGDPIGRAGHIGEAELMAEGDRSRVCALLAADADLEPGLGPATTLDADAHQFADALAIDRHERIGLQDAARGIRAE